MFGFCVRILGLGMCVGCCGCLARRVVIAHLTLLRGRCVGCIWGGVGVGCHACVGLWRYVVHSCCVSFVRSRQCVSNREV